MPELPDQPASVGLDRRCQPLQTIEVLAVVERHDGGRRHGGFMNDEPLGDDHGRPALRPGFVVVDHLGGDGMLLRVVANRRGKCDPVSQRLSTDEDFREKVRVDQVMCPLTKQSGPPASACR